MTERQQQKERAIELVRDGIDRLISILDRIDPRLLEYYTEMIDNSSSDPNDEKDYHSLWELLAALKLLRLLATYPIDYDKIHQVIRLREGEWEQVNGIWEYRRGGLLLPGSRGATHYRWLPFQIFVLTAMYACKVWVDTHVPIGTRQLLPSEREGDDGTIEDLRRLCTDFTFFAPRKTDKSGLSAYNSFLYFMLEDYDAEIYCCANSLTQAKDVLYERIKGLIKQMDPNGKRIRFTSTSTNWKDGQIRHASLYALSAGSTTKDGLFAQLCCADEYGSAPYKNGKSDMGNLVNVILSSMGPRREPMMFTSTTAGTIQSGPFMDKLDSMKRELLLELDKKWEHNPKQHLMSLSDRWMILPLMPDDWQLNEEYLLTSKTVRRKVNPTLGIIAQHSFYEEFIAKCRIDKSLIPETLSKLFNVYTFSKVDEWIKPDVIRRLQEDMRVDDCLASHGWVVFCGMDFSMGDDLYAHGYLCVNPQTGNLFADLDAWITQETLEKISIRPLYEKWIQEGWLHVCPGGVIDTEIPVRRIIELTEHGVNIMRIGFDPYRSPDPVNMLKAWVHSLGLKPDEYVVPVSQTNATYNQPTEQLTQIVKHPQGSLRFSMNPLWPYCFGCCVLEKDNRMENKKPVKRNPGSDACKVDPIQALLSAWICWNRVEGSEIQT